MSQNWNGFRFCRFPCGSVWIQHGIERILAAPVQFIAFDRTSIWAQPPSPSLPPPPPLAPTFLPHHQPNVVLLSVCFAFLNGGCSIRFVCVFGSVSFLYLWNMALYNFVCWQSSIVQHTPYNSFEWTGMWEHTKTELGNCCANSTTVTRPQHTNWSTTGNERKSNGEKKENENETRLDLCVAPEMVRITTHGARKMGKSKWEKNLFSHNRIPVAVDSYIFVRKNPMENLLFGRAYFLSTKRKNVDHTNSLSSMANKWIGY